jgi:hypothetical protein
VIVPDEDRAAPEKRRPARAVRNKERQDSSAKKSLAKESPRREAEIPRSTAITKEEAGRAFIQVERVRTYFAVNSPNVRAIEKQKLPVIAGQPMSEDIELYPLPQEVAFEVTNSCPVSYFIWERDIVLADSCSRQALAIIAGASDSRQTASGGASQTQGAGDDSVQKPVLQDTAKGEASGGTPPHAADLKPADGTAGPLGETAPAPGRDRLGRGALDESGPSTTAPEEDRPTAAAPEGGKSVGEQERSSPAESMLVPKEPDQAAEPDWKSIATERGDDNKPAAGGRDRSIDVPSQRAERGNDDPSAAPERRLE